MVTAYYVICVLASVFVYTVLGLVFYSQIVGWWWEFETVISSAGATFRLKNPAAGSYCAAAAIFWPLSLAAAIVSLVMKIVIHGIIRIADMTLGRFWRLLKRLFSSILGALILPQRAAFPDIMGTSLEPLEPATCDMCREKLSQAPYR